MRRFILSGAALALLSTAALAEPPPAGQVCMPPVKAMALDLFLKNAAVLDQELIDASTAPDRAAVAAKQASDQRAAEVKAAVAKQKGDDDAAAKKIADDAAAAKKAAEPVPTLVNPNVGPAPVIDPVNGDAKN